MRDEARQRRQERASRQPTWTAATQRALISGVAFVLLIRFLWDRPWGTALVLGIFVTAFDVPLGYYTDKFVYRRRMAKRARSG